MIRPVARMPIRGKPHTRRKLNANVLSKHLVVTTLSPMHISYDQDKDTANIAKHGLSLAHAARLDWDTLIAMPDTRHNYGEQRMTGYAFIGTRLYCVIFVDRQNTRRIISLRKANPREVKSYVSHN